MPQISIDNSSKSKVTVEGLLDQNKSQKQIENNKKIVEQNSKKIEAIDKKKDYRP